MGSKVSEGARLSPEARRSSLIDAVLRSILKHGQAGLSVRMVCQEAGVSAGLVTHHFPGKEALIVEAYRKLTQDIYSQLYGMLEASEAPARERLRLLIDGTFRQPVLDRDYLKVWLVFWSLSQQKPEIAVLREEVNDRVVGIIRRLMDEVVAAGEAPPLNTRLAAIGLSALIDGLWLEWSLNPTNFSPDEAIAICQCWIDSLLAGALGRLSAGRDQPAG